VPSAMTFIPHRRWRYRQEVEVVGLVNRVLTPLGFPGEKLYGAVAPALSCPRCQASDPIPLDTPAGREIAEPDMVRKVLISGVSTTCAGLLRLPPHRHEGGARATSSGIVWSCRAPFCTRYEPRLSRSNSFDVTKCL
jgi:hypothetical protein